jgi:branched-chain amino acid transport system permease protein
MIFSWRSCLADCHPVVIVATVVLGVLIEKAATTLALSPRMSIMIPRSASPTCCRTWRPICSQPAERLPYHHPSEKVFQIGPVSASLVTFLTPVLTLILVFILMYLINHTKLAWPCVLCRKITTPPS